MIPWTRMLSSEPEQWGAGLLTSPCPSLGSLGLGLLCCRNRHGAFLSSPDCWAAEQV